jgi:hypothetical protein
MVYRSWYVEKSEAVVVSGGVAQWGIWIKFVREDLPVVLRSKT